MIWTLEEVNKFASDLKSDGVIDNEEAFDIARFILEDEVDLYDFIRYKMKIQSPVEWLTQKII